MNPTRSPATGLNAETDAMHALLALLVREQTCLSAGDADGCAALLEHKSAQVSALAALAAQRHRLLSALGYAGSEQGMIDWLRAADDRADDVADNSATAARQAWDALMAVTRTAHETNRVNGMLLSQLAASNRQALDALGLNTAGAGLYGPAGQTDYTAARATRVIG